MKSGFNIENTMKQTIYTKLFKTFPLVKKLKKENKKSEEDGNEKQERTTK